MPRNPNPRRRYYCTHASRWAGWYAGWANWGPGWLLARPVPGGGAWRVGQRLRCHAYAYVPSYRGWATRGPVVRAWRGTYGARAWRAGALAYQGPVASGLQPTARRR